MIAESWRYHNPVEIIFGVGKLSCLPSIVGNRNTVLITTPDLSKIGIVGDLKKLLGSSLIGIFDGVQTYPTFHTVRTTFTSLQPFKYDLIVAIGGGSTLDTAKAVAVIEASGSGDWIEDHLKYGSPFPEPFDPKPIIAIPTTGTGSEVTMWATFWDMEEKKKYSISHPLLYPRKAILDPELTLTLPEKITLYSGLDALSHAMEAIWNKNHNPVSDTFALKAIPLVHDYLPEVKNDLTNLDLRTHLLRAGLFAGLAFSNTKTALAHSISYPLTAHFGLAHGLACSLPLFHLLEFNGTKRFDRLKIMANALRAHETVESMKESIAHLFSRIGVSLHLGDYGVSERDLERIADSAFTPGRADNNIIDMDQVDIVTLVKELF